MLKHLGEIKFSCYVPPSENHRAITWAIEQQNNEFFVLEWYPDSEDVAVNAIFDSMEEAFDFIQCWLRMNLPFSVN